jgi:integrase
MARRRRGFGRIRQCQPSGRYQASYVGPDDQLHKAPETFDAREDAEGWLADRRREIDRELWSPPATAKQKTDRRKAQIRFREYAEQWVETRTVRGRPLKPRTVEHYKKLLEDHIYPTFGARPIRDITMQSVDRWYAKTLTDHPTMRAHTYSLLRTILETALTRDRLIETNPCLIRGAGTTERKIKPRPASLDELGVIVGEMPPNLKLIVLLASWCALRFGELVELQRYDIDTTERVIRVRRAAVRVEKSWKVGDPKSEAGKRDVAIPPHLIPAVTNHLAKHVGVKRDALLFPAKSGGHLQPSTLGRHFDRARVKAKRPDLRFHDLRHTGAVLAAQTGATLAELMARLGHSTPQAAMRYQHAAQGRDRLIAEALSKLATATEE